MTRRRIDLSSLGLALAAPVGAVAVSVVAAVLLLLVSGFNPLDVLSVLAEQSARESTWIETGQRAVPLYISGIAVAVGFKMNLFNIGVEGQYRLAVFVAAVAGAAVSLPPVLHVSFIIAVAMLTGGAWAAIAGVLKVTRGVNEVISTIMLNYIAIAVAAWLFDYAKASVPGDLNAKTERLDESAWIPNLVQQGLRKFSAFVFIALLLGAIFYVVVWRTRFGFRLRASGANANAARTSGIDPNRMIVTTMILSGAAAGLIGLPQLLSDKHAYTSDMTTGLGFGGITVALLGRNNPIGVAVGATVIAFLDAASRVLDAEGVPKEIVRIMQGIIVLAVVIVYELAKRYKERKVQETVRAATPVAAVQP